MARDEIIGMRELMRSIQKLDKLPQKVPNRAARAGARIALKDAKRNAPVDEGDLKRGIIMKREKRRRRGKAVYDIKMSPHMNDVFVKISKSGKRYYYPASQEYGFLTVDGRYIPGYRYLRRSIDDNKHEIEKTILETAGKEVEKILRGK